MEFTKNQLGPNASLIGLAESRQKLSTPALLLDLDLFDRNIKTMAARVAAAGLNLRPHSKGHKCIKIAQRQMQLGAVGICCATLGEAEVIAGAGIPGVLITSPIASQAMLRRLATLNAPTPGLMIVSDSTANVAALNEAIASSGKTLDVLVDYDVGQERTGTVAENTAIELARQIQSGPHTRFVGVQGYYGHLQHLPRLAERREATWNQINRLKSLCASLTAEGLSPRIVTGGGTGSFESDAVAGVFTELQPGSYPFLDREYAEIELTLPGRPRFEPSLFVQATVISMNRPGEAIINAGYKSFATEGSKPVLLSPPLEDATYEFMGDEHGRIRYRTGAKQMLAIGDVVEFLTPHCDPTINLYERYHCVRANSLVDIWPIEARGC